MAAKIQFKHIHEVLKNNDLQLEAHYDSDGCIGMIFVYNEFVDDMVKIDVDAFERMYPTKFANIQFDVDSIVEEMVKSQQSKEE